MANPPIPPMGSDEVRIIKPGKTPAKVVYRATCDRCGCIFEFDEEPPIGVWSMKGPQKWCPTPDCTNLVAGVRA